MRHPDWYYDWYPLYVGAVVVIALLVALGASYLARIWGP